MRTTLVQSFAVLAAMALQCALEVPASAGSPLATPIGMAHSEIPFAKEGLSFAKTPLVFTANLDTRETPSTIEVTLAADVLFDFDKSDLGPEAASALHNVAEIIRAKAHGQVGIRGYTDALGKDAYNQRLSERRAASVKTWLVSHEQLGAASLATSGFGALDPVAPNRKPDGSDNPEGRQLNRRVSVLIRK